MARQSASFVVSQKRKKKVSTFFCNPRYYPRSNGEFRAMKKQINPTIRAHLIRGAFYLVLFLAAYAIPFTVAQRVTIVRSLPQSGTSAPQLPTFSGGARIPRDLCDSGIIVNGGFETGDFSGWTIDGFSNPPLVTNAFQHTGNFSALAGNVSGS